METKNTTEQRDPLAEVKKAKGYWQYALRAKVRLKLSIFFYKLHEYFDQP